MLRHIFLLSIRAMARAFFCSKVTGAPPFHDVNVTQLIVIDYYYHAVVMLSCISTLTKVQKKGKLADRVGSLTAAACHDLKLPL
ncbi:hypothetical protein DU633_23945 [Salmonella enterica]|nr:hypothetical protein [Salmonella enterica]